jgi:hypothetical protein
VRKLAKLWQLPAAALLLLFAAAPYLPAANCLPQALAARALRRAHGAPANLRLGVTKTATGQLQAHARLECQGRIVLGGFSALRRYTALADLEP